MIAKKAGRKSKKPIEAELEIMYSQMSASEVAKHYGVAESTVRKWLSDYRKEHKESGN